MRTPSLSLEIVALLLLMLIPWPGPTVFKISCPRDSARIVRKLVQKKWLPVLEKRSVKLGLECPFHPSRDIFGAQQAAKQQHRASQWACAFCGKSFYTERHLDQHFDSRHKDSINMAEDAVCLADYCDVMRCEVLAAREAHGPSLGGTDIEVWRSSTHQAAMAHRTALSVSAPRDLARVTAFPSLKAPQQQARKAQQQQPPPQPQTPRCAPIPGGGTGTRGATGGGGGGREREGDANATADMCGGDKGQTLVDSSVPPAPQQQQQQRLSEMQRFKADCKPEELSKLKTRCELLVRDCIAGLLVNLSVQDFKEIEEELNRASCWYLTCDRYWEDSPPEAKASPWTLLALMGTMLAVGVVVCYYIIWVLFDSQEPWCDSPGHAPHQGDPRGGPHGPQHGYGPYGPHGPHGAGDPHGHDGYPGHPDDPAYFEMDSQGDQYIYVTYPPDLKRRLLERPAPPSQQPAPVPTTAHLHHHHHQLHHHQASQPIMAPMSHHHHYPVHVPPSPHLQHGGQHSPHAPRGSPMGPMGRSAHHQGSPKQPNPYEREWRI